MFRIVSIFAFISLTWIGSAREQYIKFYTGTNFTGDMLYIESQHPNTPYYGDFAQQAKSYSCLGYWRAFTGANYTGKVLQICNWNGFNESDSTAISLYSGSIRHAGSRDMSGQMIWLFSDYSLLGDEAIISTPASNAFSFTPLSLLTTGFSNWTLFTGQHFDGNTTCFVSANEIEYRYTLNSRYLNIQSVIRGCEGRIDAYLFGSDFDSGSDSELTENKNLN